MVAHLLLISTETPPSQGCDSLAVTYGVVLTFSKTPDVSTVIARDLAGSGRSWGLLLAGTDGQSRRVLVIDETRRMSLVMPLDPDDLPAVTSAGFAALGPPADSQALFAWLSQDCHDEMTVNVSRDVSALVLRAELGRTVTTPTAGTRTAKASP